MNAINVAILGASGYTGAELVRFLANHPRFSLQFLTADRRAGHSMSAVFPQLAHLNLPELVSIEQVNWDDVAACFCCLPHATTQEVLARVPAHVRIVDLSADFRLADIAAYAKWYGHEHHAPDLQKEAVYGLTETYRAQIQAARLVANPGCYPTCSLLPLIPLVEAGLIEEDDIVIDAKSGVSGAGRAAKEGSLFCEVAEGVHPYGVASHRHVAEIDQEMAKAYGHAVTVSFTPHLMPMSRGMLASIYVRSRKGASCDDLRAVLEKRYKDEAFVKILPKGVVPQTRHVRGSNLCLIGLAEDRVPGRILLFSAIDNLVKGASGQALQNMNLMFGLPETMGLDLVPMFP
ncbi:MAG: N-acetyl-gamma-glutamyl-phosphate reductase [Alphaproteobacteria bacterium]|nr:N-acetyl-gamma-glutamyl-phosphate reductase [Alphaproteobacteria bacterium]